MVTKLYQKGTKKARRKNHIHCIAYILSNRVLLKKSKLIVLESAEKRKANAIVLK